MRGVNLESILTPQLDAKLDKKTYDNLQLPNRNLLLRSNVGINSKNYPLRDYYFGEIKPVIGFTYTFTLKGDVGEDSSYFLIYNSGGFSSLGNLKLVDEENKIWKLTFNWRGEGTTYIRLYQNNGSAQFQANVEWVKLEKGSEFTGWVPAIEEIVNSIELPSLLQTQNTNNMTTNELNGGGYGGAVAFRDIDEASSVIGSLMQKGGQHERSEYQRCEPSVYGGFRNRCHRVNVYCYNFYRNKMYRSGNGRQPLNQPSNFHRYNFGLGLCNYVAQNKLDSIRDFSGSKCNIYEAIPGYKLVKTSLDQRKEVVAA